MSFTAHPVSFLMPSEITKAQDLVRCHLREAGQHGWAELRPDGSIADQFDQRLAAEQFDDLRLKALHSMRSDSNAGVDFVRVNFTEPTDNFEDGGLDPRAAKLPAQRWAEWMALDDEIVGVWGLSYPCLVQYLDGSTRWEINCHGIAIIATDSDYAGKYVMQPHLCHRSSTHAVRRGWAGQMRTANTELADVFSHLRWTGGVMQRWYINPCDCRVQPGYEGLGVEDRGKLIIALSAVSMVERIIQLRGADAPEW